MVESEQLEILKQGVDRWNNWRQADPEFQPDLNGADLRQANLNEADFTKAWLDRADLSKANLSGANLSSAWLSKATLIEANLSEAWLSDANLGGANFSRADLSEAWLFKATLIEANLSAASLVGADLGDADLTGADLSGADVREANLSRANLRRADLRRVDLSGADLSGVSLNRADLSRANLSRADLYGANLSGADLSLANLGAANLSGATLMGTVVEGATLSASQVYGISVWGITGTAREEDDLVITPPNQPVVTVDRLEVAQFIYLLLHNEKIRDVIDTVTSKVVLILGRFTEERKAVLDALRDALRTHNLTPVLFDFDPSANQDFTDTVTLLARMARFVIADLTDPRSVQQELTLIAPDVMVAIRPIILAGEEPWSMFSDLQRRSHGLLPVHEYRNVEDLLQGLTEHVIDPAESKRSELLPAIAASKT